MWYKNVVLLTIAVFGYLSVINAQTKTINNQIYEKIDSVWYQNYNGSQYLVDDSIVTVKFEPGLSESQKAAIIQLHNCSIVRSNSIGYYDLGITGNYGAIDVVEELLLDTLISFAEPNTIGEYCAHPDDNYYWSDQWHLRQEGEKGGIDAYIAWAKENGDPDIKIAILDSGTDILHEDLEGNIWVNPGEDLGDDGIVWDTNDMNDKDDDGNGYIDDLSGWDFADNDYDVTSTYFHGTHVAGIAGAETNDDQGVAGVAGGWNSSDKGCTMIIGKTASNQNPDYGCIDDAILYAAEQGDASVILINIEMGHSDAIKAAIDTVCTNNGCFIVAPSGNSNSEVAFPANNENVFAVGGSTEKFDVDDPIDKVGGSNSGECLMLVAPGENVYSTHLFTPPTPPYGAMTGTSVAAPQVVATAGLILSRYPGFTSSDIAEVLCITAMKNDFDNDDYPFTPGYYGTWNEDVGYGKLNANRALGIKNDINTNRELYEGNYITVDVDVTNNATLTLKENSRFYLLKDGILTVEKGSTLIIEDNVTIYGNVDNEIVINGEIQIGTGVTFQRSGSFLCEGMKLNSGSTVSDMDNVTFNGFKLENSSSELNIMNSTFSNQTFSNSSILLSNNGDIDISYSEFDGTGLYLANGTENSSSVVSVNNCDFSTTNITTAIDIKDYDNYFIVNNEINGYEIGIQLIQSGGGSNSQSIFNNEVYNCTVAGINVYNSTASIVINEVYNNDIGIRLNNNSNVSLYGDPIAQDYSLVNHIRDNTSWELYASSGSFPWYFRYNAIIDEDNAGNQGNPTDPLIYAEPPGGSIMFDVKYNCWGNDFIIFEDLFPSNYLVSPTWCPPSGGNKSSELALEDFQEGIEYFENEEFDDAKSSFEYVIETYPKTQYSSAAMKELLELEKFLESDYISLQEYYETNDSIQADSVLNKLAVFLSNKCEIEIENWQTAIDHFEDIISDPDTPEDSIFAIIDLGHLYFLMENSESRSTAQGRMIEHKPTSTEGFAEKRNYLLSLLPFSKKEDAHENIVEMQKAGQLLQNVPNPFTNSTTIFFNIKESAHITFKVFDNIGKEVKAIDASVQNKGQHKIELDMKGMPSGIYFYSIYVNGQLADSKKMIVK